MKKIYILGAMVCTLGMMAACKGYLKVIKPSLIVSLPTNIDFKEFTDIWELIDTVPSAVSSPWKSSFRRWSATRQRKSEHP